MKTTKEIAKKLVNERVLDPFCGEQRTEEWWRSFIDGTCSDL